MRKSTLVIGFPYGFDRLVVQLLVGWKRSVSGYLRTCQQQAPHAVCERGEQELP